MLRRILSALARAESDSRQLAEEDAYAYGAQLLAEAREELNRADTKAQVLLGIVGLGLGATAGGLFAGDWSPFSLPNEVEWLWWLGATGSLLALVCLAGAVYPRTTRRGRNKSETVTYFGDILQFGTVEAASKALMESCTLDLARVSDQLLQVSRIVDRKYRLIRRGFWLLLISMMTVIGSFLVAIPLR